MIQENDLITFVSSLDAIATVFFNLVIHYGRVLVFLMLSLVSVRIVSTWTITYSTSLV